MLFYFSRGLFLIKTIKRILGDFQDSNFRSDDNIFFGDVVYIFVHFSVYKAYILMAH